MNQVEKGSPVSFPKMEEMVLDQWEKDSTFSRSVELRRGQPDYVFYDGPPFATGLPHYGHILTSYIKDSVPRYFTMKGRHVPRRWGWDCHGLPVEFEVEKELGIKSKRDILDLGVETFNNKCEELVLRYAGQWRKFVTRIGRWVDFDNAYKTMDSSYTESVVWAFKQLSNRGYVYEGRKIVPYCTRCQTVLSNFEARLDDAFRPKQSTTLYAKFRSENDENEYFLAWTTTPWTLPANSALGVAPAAIYNLIEVGKERIWIADAAYARLKETHFPDSQIVEQCKGEDLVGRKYVPQYKYFASLQNAFRIWPADFVDPSDGTGFVHIAPAYGEDDATLAEKFGVESANPVKDDGTYDDSVSEYKNIHIFQAVKQIVADLQRDGLALPPEIIKHNYPHCWRCDNPLIYRAVNSWFVKVSEYRAKLSELNQRVDWVPSHIRDGRFGDWLDNARDWAVSRNRFWGAPIPVWKCGTCAHTEICGSAAEIEKRSGKKVTSFHRPAIDSHVFDCPHCEGEMTRVPDVFDCWFESGSMPFASQHYPFENTDTFEKNYPADFIVEYVAQTRGWFYTLFAVGGGCFDEEPFENAVCHGVILGRDGRKMSKRLKNYPDPMELLDQHGSDALRISLLMSSVCKGEDIKFTEESVRDSVRRFHLLWWNCLNFYLTFSKIDSFSFDPENIPFALLPIDKYMLHEIEILRDSVDQSMKAFDFSRVYVAIEKFINVLSTWYIKLNKARVWREGMDDDKATCYWVIHEAIRSLALISAPFIPFLSERVWRDLGHSSSVHLQDWPAAHSYRLEPELAASMDDVQKVVSLARNIRDKAEISLKMPLKEMRIFGVDPQVIASNRDLISEEVNVKLVSYSPDVRDLVEERITLNYAEIAASRPQIIKAVREAITSSPVCPNDDGSLTVGEIVLGEREYTRTRVARSGVESVAVNGDVVVWLDLSVDQNLLLEADAREVNRRLQDLRKASNLPYTQRIVVYVSPSDRGNNIVSLHGDYLRSQLLATEIILALPPEAAAQTKVSVKDQILTVGFVAGV